jgi:hypothetical protein
MSAKAVFAPTIAGVGRDRRHSVKRASRLKVTPVTAPLRSLAHTRIMERTLDEAGYVLAVLQKMRDEVSANPTLFDPSAQQRMDEAIVYIQDVIRSARSQLVISRVKQEIKAA